MAGRFQLVIDCADPAVMVRFWSQALHYDPEPPPGGHPSWLAYWRSLGVPEEEFAGADDSSESLVDPDGAGPRIWFQAVPEPKTVKNRLHLDLPASGGRTVPLPVRQERVDAEVSRLLQLGAHQLYVLSTDGVDHYGVVMQDPEGNEFCVH